MSAIYGLNPFFNTPETISHDPLYPMIFWKTVTTAYGPLWSLLSSFLVTITGRSVLLNIFGFKSTLLIFHLGTGLVLYRLALAIHTEKSKYIAFLYLFNPYILFMNLVENHNDIIMVFFLILAFYLLVKDKFLLSTVALSLSIATKYIPILLVPLFFIYIYRKIPGIKNKVLLTIKSLSLNAGVFYLLWKPFNLNLFNLSNSIQTMKSRLDDNTIPYVTYKALELLRINISVEQFRLFSDFAFIFFCAALYICFLIKKKPTITHLIQICIILYAGYFITASFQFGSWYILWITPLILLSDFSKKNFLFLLLTFVALISFWKRISFLLIGSYLIYLVIISLPKKNKISKFLADF